MKHSWIGPTLQIAAIFAFRMLGLFMLIPIFTLYAADLPDASPALLGIALGGYGLTQGLLQIPFGMLSDRFGRRPLIAIGLGLFAIGSLIGAQAHTISGMILARVLQGGGAIGSVLIALLADITHEHHRTKAMALIGAIIGLSFSIAFLLSPSLAAWTGLAGVFYFTAALAMIGLGILYTLPNPKIGSSQPTSTVKHIRQALVDPKLLCLDAGIFFQHFILVASFYALPIILQQYVQNGQLEQNWHFYIWVIPGSFIAMIPIMLYSEQRKKVKTIFLFAVACTGFCQLAMLCTSLSLFGLGFLLFGYFVAFNFLEANLPSLISKQANPQARGSALGVYSSSQFLGIFVGGSVAGILYSHTGITGIFILNTVVAFIWLGITWNSKLRF